MVRTLQEHQCLCHKKPKQEMQEVANERLESFSFAYSFDIHR